MSIKLMTAVWAMQNLTPTQKLVLLALADNASDEGICWPSLTTITAKTSLSRRAVTDALADLEGFQCVSRDPGNPNRTTRYLVHPTTSAPNALGQDVPYGRAPDALEVGRQVPYGRAPAALQPSYNHQSEPSLNTQSVREVVDIVALKLAYPRGTYAGVAWMDAERACNQLLEEGETPETILAAVTQYADQQLAMGRIGTQFITSPAKFFRSGLWRGPFPLPEKPQPVKLKSTWLEQEDDDA